MTPEPDLVRDDAAAREAALDVGRSFIVQAPAGSGKTELLIQRYLRLLAIVEDPEEILAITFTRKAAAEMQLRVITALERSAREEAPRHAHEQITAAAAAAALARDRDRGWNIVDNPRRMRIQTLDSLNAFIARSQPLTASGGSATNSVVGDAQMQGLYREAAGLTLDQLAEPGDLGLATEQVLSHLDYNTSLYIAYLARMLATRDQWLPFVGSGVVDPGHELELRRRFEGNLEGAVQDHLHRVREALPPFVERLLLPLADFAAARLVENGRADSPTCALRGLPAFPEANVDALSQWRGVAEMLLTGQGQYRKTVNKTQGFPAGEPERQTMLELLAEIAGETEFRELLEEVRLLPPVRYTDEQWQVLLALFRLLPVAVTELKRLFGSGGTTDYIEIALNAAAALGTADDPGDVALLLDYRLSHILVDEMQDTSSAQYRMLEALTGGWEEGDGRTLFCVGDPMQSIYRFRSAEVGQFLMARSNGLGNLHLQPLTLRRNFRSGERLVDWFNSVFPGVLAARNDPRRSAVAYSAAISAPALAGLGMCEVHPVFGSGTDTEAAEGCRVIQELLRDNPADDVAVLVRGRTQLPRLLAMLRTAGVAYRAVEIDRLTDLPEIIDVLALTRAIVHRGDRLAWLALLRAPWAGLDWTELHILVADAGDASIWQLLQDEHRLAQLSPHGQAAVERIRRHVGEDMKKSSRTETLRNRVERLWLLLGGPAVVADANALENVYRYLEVIGKLEVAGTLDDVAGLEAALDLERVSSQDSARLQVMTMHRAKGLQFDHVLLYGLGRTPGRRERGVLSWFDIPSEHGSDEKIISPVGPRAVVDKDPLHQFIERTESAKDRNELARLLYVACTRARKSLHLLGHVELDKDGDRFRVPRADSLLRLLWPAVEGRYAAAFGSPTVEPPSDTAPAWLTPQLRRLSRAWSLPEAGPVPGPGAPAGGDNTQAVDFYWVGTHARIAGTMVHRWLQLAVNGGIDLAGIDAGRVNRSTLRWLAEAGLGKEAAAPIAQRVQEALHAIGSDETGQWLLHGAGHAELALSGIDGGRLSTVILDRVRIDDDGAHWVVDYKTSTHEGGDLDAFLAAEADRYRPQLRKYARFYRGYAGVQPKCALYFPLLRKFIEVDV